MNCPRHSREPVALRRLAGRVKIVLNHQFCYKEGVGKPIPFLVNLMNLDDITPQDLNILALAMDYLLCNADLPPAAMKEVEELFYFLDAMAEAAEDDQEEQSRLVEKTDNLLVVDFRPKAG